MEEVNKTLTCFISNEAGNGLLTRDDFEGGDLIIRILKPHVFIPENSVIDHVCYHCLADDAKLQKCSGCSTVKYCSKLCQKTSWQEIHKKECKVFRKVKEEGHPILPTPVRGVVQLLLRYASGSTPDPLLPDLKNHRDAFVQKERIWADIILQARAAVNYSNLPIQMMDIATSALCSLKVNAFNAAQPDDTPVGLCFDPLLAKVNHSCVPNAFVSFDGRKVSLKALKSIQNGEEIMISYIDPTQPRHERQQKLLENYMFTCRCPRCSADWNVYAAFLKNPSRKANKFSIITNYRELEVKAQGPVHISTEMFTASHEPIDSILDEALELTNPHERWIALRKALEKLNVLRQQNLPAVAPYPTVLRHLLKNFIHADEIAAALITMLTLVFHVEPYEFPEPWHPVRISTLYSLAGLLNCILDDPALSLETLTIIQPSTVTGLQILPSMYAILLLITEFAPRSHGASSRFSGQVRQRLEDIENLVKAQRNPGGLAMLKYGIKEGAGYDTAVRHWQQLEALAEVNLMHQVIETVDCKGGGHKAAAAGI